MPSVSLSQPHALGKDEALNRLKTFLAKVKERHQDKVSNLQEDWQDNKLAYSFSTYGFNIKGDVVVDEGEVRLNSQLPMAAMMFKGKIEQTIRDELNRVLA